MPSVGGSLEKHIPFFLLSLPGAIAVVVDARYRLNLKCSMFKQSLNPSLWVALAPVITDRDFSKFASSNSLSFQIDGLKHRLLPAQPGWLGSIFNRHGLKTP